MQTNVSESQFSHLKNGNNKILNCEYALGIHRNKHMKPLAKCKVYDLFSINAWIEKRNRQAKNRVEQRSQNKLENVCKLDIC